LSAELTKSHSFRHSFGDFAHWEAALCSSRFFWASSGPRQIYSPDLDYIYLLAEKTK